MSKLVRANSRSYDVADTGVTPTRYDELLKEAQHRWKTMFNRRNDEHHDTFQSGTSMETILTRPNRKINEPWGDELTEKPAKVTRVYAQNINGLSIDRQGGQFDDVCRVHNEVQADIVWDKNTTSTPPRCT